MRIRRIHALAVFLFCSSVLPTIPHQPTNAQDNKELSWQNKLYESEVRYENFACRREDAETVAAFFKEHPLRRSLPICHNDCPVIKCRPVILVPSLAKAARVTGTVSVHILVDEQGKLLFARPLSGNPLLWASVRTAACETRFQDYLHRKQQGVMHFTFDNSGYVGVPFEANQVR